MADIRGTPGGLSGSRNVLYHDEGDNTHSEAYAAHLRGYASTTGSWIPVETVSGAIKVYNTASTAASGGGVVQQGARDSTAQAWLVSLVGSGTVLVSQASSFTVLQGTSPWLISQAGSVAITGNVNVSQAGSFAVTVGTVNVSQAGSFSVTQGTNPWNSNTASYGGAATTLGQKVSASSMPVVLPSDQTVNTNLASQTASVTVTANQGTSAATSNAWPIKPTRDISRTPLTFWVDDVAGISTEALATMNITKAGLSQTTSTSYIVTAGKILRLCGFVVSTRASVASIQAARARVRQGNAATHSVLLSVQAGIPVATINAVGINDEDIAEGAIELPASTSLCISHVETSIASNTFSCCLIGYEYTP